MGLASVLLGASMAPATPAREGGILATVHNLSASGPGEIRALAETEVCKFCHIPHNATVPEPLWGHALPRAARYETPPIRSRGASDQVAAPQPDGSSRLCLSCHDGTVALGEVAGEARSIAMAGSQRLGPGRAGFLGTDLSGAHPVSFVVPDGDPGLGSGDHDMGLRPRAAIDADPDVRLDRDGKMQCTTCHDPHTDRYFQEGRVPHFWVKATVAEVCLVCHELR